MVDVLRTLERASFDDIEFPIEGACDFGFSHQFAEYAFIFKNDALLEKTGRKNLTFRYQVPLIENMAKGPWKDLYTATFPEFLNACYESQNTGEAKILTDPALGSFPVICVNFQGTHDAASRRDGATIQVDFIHSPGINDLLERIELIGPTLENVKSLAGALDRQVPQIDFPPGEEPGEPFQDPFTAITSVTDQINNTQDRIGGKLDQLSYKLDKMNKSIERLPEPDPTTWTVQQNAKDLRLAALRTKQTINAKNRRVRQQIIPSNTPIGTLANRFDMTLQEFLDLNRDLARAPIVPARTTINYFVRE